MANKSNDVRSLHSVRSVWLTFLQQQYQEIPAESPPAYDAAVAGPSNGAVNTNSCKSMADVASGMAKPHPVAPMSTTPLIHPATTPGSPDGHMVYHYQHPVTGHQIVSLLPPDHPQMVCLQRGHHDVETRFGFLGACLSPYSCMPQADNP